MNPLRREDFIKIFTELCLKAGSEGLHRMGDSIELISSNHTIRSLALFRSLSNAVIIGGSSAIEQLKDPKNFHQRITNLDQKQLARTATLAAIVVLAEINRNDRGMEHLFVEAQRLHTLIYGTRASEYDQIIQNLKEQAY